MNPVILLLITVNSLLNLLIMTSNNRIIATINGDFVHLTFNTEFIYSGMDAWAKKYPESFKRICLDNISGNIEIQNTYIRLYLQDGVYVQFDVFSDRAIYASMMYVCENGFKCVHSEKLSELIYYMHLENASYISKALKCAFDYVRKFESLSEIPNSMTIDCNATIYFTQQNNFDCTGIVALDKFKPADFPIFPTIPTFE